MEIQSECLVRKNTTECFVGESYLVYEDINQSIPGNYFFD